MAPRKPESVARSPYKSAKWDEVTAGRAFSDADVPTLTLLVQWHQVVDRCIEDMDIGGDIQLAYENKMGDIKPFPQLATMKQASAEIRALNKQLGINDEAEGGSGVSDGVHLIDLAAERRSMRRARAADQG